MTDKARELLAAEYEVDFPRVAASIRSGRLDRSLGTDRALRAIEAALSTKGEASELVKRLREYATKSQDGFEATAYVSRELMRKAADAIERGDQS